MASKDRPQIVDSDSQTNEQRYSVIASEHLRANIKYK